MLVLTRKPFQAIVLKHPAGDVKVIVQWSERNKCSLMIDAPASIRVLREELVERKVSDEQLDS